MAITPNDPRAARAKRLRNPLTMAYRGELTDDGLSEAAAWRKEMERRRLGAQKRYEHDPAFNPKLPKLKLVP